MFPAFFARVLALRLPERQAQLAQHEQTAYLLFMINAFQSLEDEMVRGQVGQPVLFVYTPTFAHKRLRVPLMAAHTRTPACAYVNSHTASMTDMAAAAVAVAVPRQGS